MSVTRFTSLVAAALIGTVASQSAFAAGYEKNIMWSGRYGGQGGAAVSVVQGSEALYFNPAGLVSDRVGQDVSVNFSVITADYKGPIATDNVEVNSTTNVSTPFGVIYNMTPNEKWGIGAGVYVSGGAAASFDDVFYPGFALQPDIKTSIQLIEFAFGGAYRINEQWKVGAAWRAGLVTAELAAATQSTLPPAQGSLPILTAVRVKDLDDYQFDGFKVGVQFKPNETWGLGAQLRTEFKFELEGNSSGQVNVPGAGVNADLTGGPATVTSRFPLQAAFGGYWNIVPDVWRAHLEYVFTDYSVNETLVINGNLTSPAALGGTTSEIPDITQDWKDQHNIRLAGEFLGIDWPVRFGYVWTSQVTSEGYARASFSAPGDGHTITLGTGKGFMEDKLQFNTALEYSFITGKVDTPAQTATKIGNYSTIGTSLHLGVAYLF